MRRDVTERILCVHLTQLIKSIAWLVKSYNKCRDIELEKFELLKDEEIEGLEAFANRFGRSIDILLNKVLRSLDLLELEDVSKKLDIVIRAEKRGFVDNYEQLIEVKDLRNELFHEYIEDSILETFKEIIEKTPFLLDTNDKINKYVEENGYCKQ